MTTRPTPSPWQVPDAGFAPQHLAHLRKAVAALPGAGSVLAAIAAGSRAAGLAHARSDLDVILVFATDAERNACDADRLPHDLRKHDGLALDLIKITTADLERLRDTACARAEASREIHRPGFMLGSFREWALLTRVVTGDVMFAEPRVRALLECLDRDALRRDVMTHSALCLASLVEDVAGTLGSGDLATALAASEEGLRTSVDAALAGCDDLWVGRKFLQRRMARNPFLARILDEHGHRVFGGFSASFDESVVRDTIRWRLALAGHLLGRSLLDAWSGPVDGLPLFNVPASGPVRNPCYAPVRWAGGFGLMVGVDVVHRLTEDSFHLWNLCDGRGTEDVISDFAGRTRGGASGGGAWARGQIRDWESQGVLRPRAPAPDGV
ncbi:nucleotidyltransferase domain-containing protein [Spirillospora sp. NPDC047279]|uniref:nucleotidyltransferase domain-containing protein n=1 Tax=Spirillospora sp. NPDC047279 TaxID=3155478 RepID=UPI0033F49093